MVLIAATLATLFAGCTSDGSERPETSSSSPFMVPFSELPDDLPSPPEPFASLLGNRGQGGSFAHSYLAPFGMRTERASKILFDFYEDVMPESGWSKSDQTGERAEDWRLLWARDDQLLSVSWETDLGNPYLLVEACPPFLDGFCKN